MCSPLDELERILIHLNNITDMKTFSNCRASELDDSTYSSTSEAEPDSDHDMDDPNKLLGTWLGELENLKMELDNVSSKSSSSSTPGEKTTPLLDAPKFTIDSFRFSMANLEDSPDVDLDAILGELCALETELENETNKSNRSHLRSNSLGQPHIVHNHVRRLTLPHTGSESLKMPQAPTIDITPHSDGGFENDEPTRFPHQELCVPSESPDNDSAFSDSVSMVSCESSASSAARTDSSHSTVSSKSSSASLTVPSPTQTLDAQQASSLRRRLRSIEEEVANRNLPSAEQAARIKAEKIKIALEKIKEANIKKLFIKAFSADGSTKSLLVDENMTCGHIAWLLAEKNHVRMGPQWAIVEHLPDLYMERIFEDHEYLVENLLLWTRDSKNKLLFLEKEEKRDLFIHPEDYLLMESCSEKGSDFNPSRKKVLTEEFFSGSGVPEVEGTLYLKSDGKKAWKKHFFVLRASGLYYSPKGKSKASKDLLCLIQFEMVNLYRGIGWKKKYKAPTDYCFSLKHPQIQTKASKYIKYLCAEDDKSLKEWITGIRIVKHGKQLWDNYEAQMTRLEEEEDAETFRYRCSVASYSSDESRCTEKEDCISNGLNNNYKEVSNNVEELAPRAPSSERVVAKVGSLEDLPQLQEVPKRKESVSTTTTPVKESNSQNTLVHRKSSIRRSDTGNLSDKIVFETDFPTGTIKRKPSLTPKMPLTHTTKQLVKQSSDDDSLNTTSCETTPTKSIHEDFIPSPLLPVINHPEEDFPPPPLDTDLPPPPASLLTTPACSMELPPPPPELLHGTDRPLTPEILKPSPPLPPPKPSKDVQWRACEQERIYGNTAPFLEELKNKSPKSLRKASFRLPRDYENLMIDDEGKTLLQIELTNNHIHRQSPHIRTAISDIHYTNDYQCINSLQQQFNQSVLILSSQPPTAPLPPPPPPIGQSVKQKPPPPKRSESTRLSTVSLESRRDSTMRLSKPGGPAFLADLQRVMEKKMRHSNHLKTAEFNASGEPACLSCDCLPPPPPELLDHTNTILPKKKPPPPPPKRSSETHLSIS